MGRLWLSLACLVLSACGRETVPIELTFRALVGDRAFSCNGRFADVGAAHSTVTFSDLRMYVSALRVRTTIGERVAVELVPDGRNQDREVALLDFEDGSGSCSGGTTAQHVRVRARAPAGPYRSLEIELGVPFAANHGDASMALAPLDVTHMFWVWRNGYKFLRLDGKSHDAAQTHGFSVHLGSTGCSGGAFVPTAPPARCLHPNRALVRLSDFDPARHTVDLHLETLLSSLTLHGAAARDGCESSPDDPDCAPVMAALGLAAATPTPSAAFRKGEQPR